MNYITSGYKKFDQTFNGFKENNVTVYSNRPGMGVTLIMMNHAIEIAKNDTNVLFLSREMTNRDFFNRSLAKLTDVSLTKITNQTLLTKEESEKIKDVIENEILFFGKSCRFETLSKTEEIKKTIQFHKTMFNAKVIFIDIGEMNDKLLESLIDLAKTENLTIITNHLLHRNIEKRSDKRPNKEDLNSLVRFEDKVDFYAVYREEVYDKDTKQANTIEVYSLNLSEKGKVGFKMDINCQQIL